MILILVQFLKTFLFTFCALQKRLCTPEQSVKMIHSRFRVTRRVSLFKTQNACHRKQNVGMIRTAMNILTTILLPEVDRCVIKLKNVQLLTNPQRVLMIVSTKDPDYLVQHVLVVRHVFHFNLKKENKPIC